MTDHDEKVYEETGKTYRFFAKWRQLAFAGYLAVLAAVTALLGTAIEHQYAHVMFWFWFGVAVVLLMSGVFWIVDKRTRRLAYYAIKAGAGLESGTKGGFFTATMADSARSSRFDFRHTDAAIFLYFGSPVVFTLAALGFGCWVNPSVTTIPDAIWEYKIVSLSMPVTDAELKLNGLASEGWIVVSPASQEQVVSNHWCFILKRQKK